jgi:hypothetical protein
LSKAQAALLLSKVVDLIKQKKPPLKKLLKKSQLRMNPATTQKQS